MSRIEAMLGMMTALANGGVRKERYHVRVSHDEFTYWRLDQVKMQKWAEYTPATKSVDVYGPHGLLVIVSKRE